MSTALLIILASGSPRRREILSLLGKPFEVMVPKREELPGKGSPEDRVKALARAKGEEILEELKEAAPGECLVIAADTLVFLGEESFGKPKDREDARRMLNTLSGKTHQVWTGVYLGCPGRAGFPVSFAEKSEVTFRALDEEELSWYLSTKEPYDKAGAYAVQGMFSPFIREIRGDFYNVMGLPLSELYQRLKESGVYLIRTASPGKSKIRFSQGLLDHSNT